MAKSSNKLDAVAQRKQKKKHFWIFFGIISALVLYVALQVASYQNSRIGTSEETGNFFLGLVGSFEDLMAHPEYAFSFDLIGKYTLPSLGVALLICVLGGALLYYDNERHLRDMAGAESGTAKWNHDYKGFNSEYVDAIKEKNTLLSKNVSLSLDTRKTLRNNNVLVIGGSGSGKTRFFVKPNVLQANCNMVITDPSGELLSSTGDFLQKQGYEIKVFNLVEMNKSNCYNPFHYIRDPQGVIMMINCLIKNTTPPESHSNDPFWEKSETALLQALIFYLRDYRPVEEQNFGTVMELLSWAEVDERNPDHESKLDRIFLKSKKQRSPVVNAQGKTVKSGAPTYDMNEYLGKTKFVDANGTVTDNTEFKSIEELDTMGTSIALKQYRVFKQAGGKTAKSILISCQVRLAMFNIPQLAHLTNVDDIHLEEMSGMNKEKKKQALFVIIPAADSTFNFLVSMMYSQLFETLYYLAETKTEDQRLPVHIKFLLDEFANIGTIPEFTKKLATMRKYEISCSVILQNLAQIKTMYKDDWESIVGNSDTMLYLGGKELTTMEYVSKELGKQTITVRDRSSSERVKGGSFSKNYKQTARELMLPEEIGNMDNSKCIVMIRGLDPFFDTKYDYKAHPRYKDTADADRKLRYINTLDNMKAGINVETLANSPDESEKINKVVSLDELVLNNPEWGKYPDIFAEFKVVAEFAYEDEIDEEDTPEAVSETKEKPVGNEPKIDNEGVIEDVDAPATESFTSFLNNHKASKKEEDNGFFSDEA
ncbi:MAG: type IV secretory system conjugative DNA transfer family protein [Bacteroidaceae bacterium]|nr:type IV secretory system conjugative DNA transfer family protein [Bacteroidaceae bacterium]